MNARFGTWGALVLAASLGTAGCGTGSACGADCGAKAECAMVGSNLTALPALDAGRTAASAVLPGPPRWAGGLQGLRIRRDGTPSQEPASQILGTAIYASGWVYKFCSGSQELVFGAGPPTATVERGCGTIDCDKLPDFQVPAVDSAALITTAFPSDPGSTLYGMTLVLVGTNERVWKITRLPDGPTVQVHADTGAVVP